MKRETISDAVGSIGERYVREAADYRPQRAKRGARRALVAAAAALCLLLGGALLRPGGGASVSAYAYGTESELTASGVVMTTGAIRDDGTVSGYPLRFFLAGDEMKEVRFSCRRQYIRFTDGTEKRDEFGVGQSFTVPYGENTSEYYFLLLDWVPRDTIRALAEQPGGIAALPEELREDVIVLEITFADEKKATRAVTVRLRDDGTFFAAFDAYTVRPSDDFVRRSDSRPIPRDILYGEPELTVTFRDRSGNAAEPLALWYNFAGIDSILVQWSGAPPESVQAYYTPAGTETLEQTELLVTKIPHDGESAVTVTLSAEKTANFFGHLHFELNYGDTRVLSEVYNVLYDEEDQRERDALAEK